LKRSTQKATWTSVGCTIALLAGSPAVADDTELLLINPNPGVDANPNVMFILDTSGSMLTNVLTVAPYNGAATYFGPCFASRIYWTDVDVVPFCDMDQNQYIAKTAFHCQSAAGQMAGLGSYTNIMVQYRGGGNDGSSGGPASWQYLAPGYHDLAVECQADSGIHGDGRPAHLWAASGTDLADPFTSNPDNELSWGSAPRNLAYTLYDGNYLNWKNSAPEIVMSRLDIIKAVTKTVLSSVDNLNVGLMQFNTSDGGPVIFGIADLESNIAIINHVIDSLQADGFSPLSETLYENALYWRGMPAYFGERINETPTDPLALTSSSPEIYKQPTIDACAKNYNVLLTDGEPDHDEEGETRAPTLPNFASALGRNTCTFAVEGDCLDDISEYLYVEDIDNQTKGVQVVTTHTIGFDLEVDLPILADTAHASGGEYFMADEVESLTRSLMSIIANINEKSQSFSAPILAVNTFNRTQNLNDIYLTMFGAKSRTHWPGNLKKYRITDSTITDSNGADAIDPLTGYFFDTALSFWTADGPDGHDVTLGGAARRLPSPIARQLYTNNGDANLSAASNQITPANAGAFADADFGLTGAEGEPTIDEIIRWSRGEDLLDEDNNPATTVRYAMGDPLHSQPAAIGYGGTEESPDVVVYTATNDGYLHAIDGKTGQELWSFVPKEFLSNFTRLYFDPDANFKQYGIDGNIVPVVKDVNRNGIVDGADFVYILFGLRRGGDSYYALDVTNKNAPKLLWNVRYPDMGESWSTPSVARMDINTVGLNADKAVVVIGGGYDTVHDTAAQPDADDGAGAGLYFLDLVTGAELWRAGRDSGADLQLDDMTRSIATQVRVIDFSGDGFADRMYASDMGGQIWRFDIATGATPSNLVTGGVIARLGAEGQAFPGSSHNRRFYNAPDVSMFVDHSQNTRYVAVSIGSGYRAHPFDLSAGDRFFSIRDGDVFNQLSQPEYDGYDIVTDLDLVEVSGRKQVILQSTDRGWKFTLPPEQKVLADSITFNDEIFFVAFSPDVGAGINCAAGAGANFLYRVSVVNGDPIVNNLDALLESEADEARLDRLQQGGIAPAPTILFPSPDDPDNCEGPQCTPPPIMCIGVECREPLFPNNPVRTLWTQDGIQ